MLKVCMLFLFSSIVAGRARGVETVGTLSLSFQSPSTPSLFVNAGDWITPREKSVQAKGKGALETFWLKISEDNINYLEGCRYDQMKLPIGEVL